MKTTQKRPEFITVHRKMDAGPDQKGDFYLAGAAWVLVCPLCAKHFEVHNPLVLIGDKLTVSGAVTCPMPDCTARLEVTKNKITYLKAP